ncbi:MAG TPA: L-threonylcarbamoyladenylate synthase [Bacteroidales bacterium]|nr:L-threonylcarbamoyladenylate synthase [Bacteroidales bacterium]HPS17341.1 L-threonylcarbamoyladenylate synthase [Bacteroidales bacterium]
MLIKLYPENPNPRHIGQIVECLKNGGIIIYPTDTVYGMGCDIFQHKAVERIAQIKGIRPEKANFSFICYDLSHLSDFTKQISNDVFKLMKRTLPGPFTYILNANNNVPKLFESKKKTVGIRIPDNSIAREIVNRLGNPIMSTSIKDNDDLLQYTTDPELIYERYRDIVDIVIDGGFGGIEPSTVIDCTKEEFDIIRQGKGIVDDYS